MNDEKWLKMEKMLRCPKCKGDLKLKGNKFICDTCKLAYPIIDDIPRMMINDAEKLE